MNDTLYELILDGEAIDAQPKCREGLNTIYALAESVIADAEFQLEIYCSKYEQGYISSSELIEDFIYIPQNN